MSLAPGIEIVGGGGHAKVVIATLEAAGLEPVGIWDDDPEKRGTELLGVPVVGNIAQLAKAGRRRAVLAVGENRARRGLAARLDLAWVTVVHPAAWVAPSARLGAGTVVFAGAVVQPDTVVGAHAIVNTGASIDHDGRIGDFVHVAPGVRLAGGVTVGEGALLGIGSVVIPGIEIGEWSVVGAGAAVVSEVAPKTTVVGVPARLLRG